MENSLQVCPEINFCLYFLSQPPTEGLATEGACGAITVTGDGQGLDLSWSGVTRAAGDTARRTSILAASVSVVTPCQDNDLCNTLYLQRLGVTRPQWTDSRPWPP